MTETENTQNWIYALFFDDEGKMSYWGPFSVVVALQTLCFLFCQIVKDNSHVDSIWSWTFMMPNLAMILVLMQNGTPIDLRTIVMSGCLWAWGLRLSLHIGCRHKEEDYRY